MYLYLFGGQSRTSNKLEIYNLINQTDWVISDDQASVPNSWNLFTTVCIESYAKKCCQHQK